MKQASELATWKDGPAKAAILDFVRRTTTEGSPEFLPLAERVAVYDNDGTLWAEKPMPVELGFILQKFAQMATKDPSLQSRQPWKAAYEKDYAWLSGVITKHYLGDNSDVKVLIEGILKAFENVSVDDYQAEATAFLQNAVNPVLKRKFRDCNFVPMIDLLRYFEAHGFVNYIASGGNRDFMRVITDEIYGIPAERVVGSSNELCYTADDQCGKIAYLAKPDVFDDGPAKPVRIWSRIGRRPAIAVGNSNGDIPMLQFAGGPSRPALRLLLLHDDKAREFDYTAGAEKALEMARARNWTVVSIKNDWTTVFAAENSNAALPLPSTAA